MLKTRGDAFNPTQDDMNNWNRLFPDIDVEHELSKMAQWLTDNPTKRREFPDIRRQVITWLGRASQVGGSPEIARPAQDGFQRDEIYHALKPLMEFFNKPLDRSHMAVWNQSFAGYSPDEIRHACKVYPTVGKFAPKPAEIIQIMREARDVGRQHERPEAKREHVVEAPEHVRKAWVWFMRMAYDLSFSSWKSDKNVTPEQADEYLRTVNEQAKASGNPDAIPDEYKLKEIWGNF